MSRPPPSWIVLGADAVISDAHKRAAQQPCLSLALGGGSRQAVGFNADFNEEVDEANEYLQALRVEARLADAPNLSSLTLGRGIPVAFIHTSDKNVIVFVSTLRTVWTYLIYDSLTDSLTLIPSVPPNTIPKRTNRVLVARRRPGADANADVDVRSYALVLMLQREELIGEEDYLPDNWKWKDALFLWRPSSSSLPWKQTKKAVLPDQLQPGAAVCDFKADAVFSFDGRAFWGDLLRGVLSCSCDDLLADDVDRVGFTFVGLPLQCQRPDLRNSEAVAEPEAYRAMDCAGGAIKFVSIDGFAEPVYLRDRKVTMWRLDHWHPTKSWVKEHEVSLRSLWRQPEFRRARLPRSMTLMFPILSTQDADVVCFLLGDFYMVDRLVLPTRTYYCLRVDMRRGKLLSAARLPYVWFAGLSIFVGSELARYLPRLDPDGVGEEDAVQEDDPARTNSEDVG